jgi:hypothetical protein
MDLSNLKPAKGSVQSNFVFDLAFFYNTGSLSDFGIFLVEHDRSIFLTITLI